jgi:hypothetical protein
MTLSGRETKRSERRKDKNNGNVTAALQLGGSIDALDLADAHPAAETVNFGPSSVQGSAAVAMRSQCVKNSVRTLGHNMAIVIALLTVAAVLGVCAIAIWIDAPSPRRKPAGHGRDEADDLRKGERSRISRSLPSRPT